MLSIEPCTREDHLLYEQKTGYRTDPAEFRAIKAVKDGKILGIIGFDYWTPTAVQMHVWIGTPAALRDGIFLKEVFTYAFVTNKKKVAFGIIPSDNVKALKFIWNVGFTEVTRLKDGWDDGIDMVINEIRPGNCRWL